MYARAGVSVCLQNIHLICKNMWVKKKREKDYEYRQGERKHGKC